MQRCIIWCWFTWILEWVHSHNFSSTVKVWSLITFLVVFQKTSTLEPIKGCPGIHLYSVPSWASDCYVRLSVTHTHKHTCMHTVLIHTHKCLCVIMRLRPETQTSCGSRQTTLSHTSLISCSLTSLHLYFLSSLWSTHQTQTQAK